MIYPTFGGKQIDDERCNYAGRVQRICRVGHCFYSGKFVTHGTVADCQLCGDCVRLVLRRAQEPVDEGGSPSEPSRPSYDGQDGDVLLVRVHGVHDQRGSGQLLCHRPLGLPAGVRHRVPVHHQQHPQAERVQLELQRSGCCRAA